MTISRIEEMAPDQREYLDRLWATNPELAADLTPRPPGPPSTELCIHEAGHAVLQHVFGRRVEYVLVRECSGCVMPCPSNDFTSINHSHQIAMILAGDMAAADVDPWQEADWRAAIAAYIRGEKLGLTADCAVEAQSDQRHAVIFAWAASGGSSSIDAIYAHIREGWNIAVELLGTVAVWTAIINLAEQLRSRHRIEGVHVHDIIESSVKFGAFADRWPCPSWQPAPKN